MIKVSTLGPIHTNSYYAAKMFIKQKKLGDEPILSDTPEASFSLLLENKVQYCVVCNLYPKIHKLYLPNLDQVTASDVFIYFASMGLFKRNGVTTINTVACTLTSTAFLRDDRFESVIVNSNAEAAIFCEKGKVDAAVATTIAAEKSNLLRVIDFGSFAVPYTVFTRK